MIIFFAFQSSMICCCYVRCSSLFIESEHSSFFPQILSRTSLVSHSTEKFSIIQLPQNTQKLLRERETKEAARSLDVSHGIF